MGNLLQYKTSPLTKGGMMLNTFTVYMLSRLGEGSNSIYILSIFTVVAQDIFGNLILPTQVCSCVPDGVKRNGHGPDPENSL